MQALTDTGDMFSAAISPDGKYVAILRRETDGRDSVWMRHLPTNSTSQIVPPGSAKYDEVTFGRDGNYIFLRSRDKQSPGTVDLIRVPVLGGPVTRVVHNIDSPPSFYRDRLCFLRLNAPKPGMEQLLSANLDGTEEKVIYTGQGGHDYGPAWSPDGRRIMLLQQVYPESEFILIDAATGKRRSFYKVPKSEVPESAVWNPRGDGLIFATHNGDAGVNQLNYLSYPGAVQHTITNDLSWYDSPSISDDGKSLTIASVVDTTLYEDEVLPANGSAQGVAGRVVGKTRALDWISDEKLLLSESLDGVLQTATLDGQKSVLLSDTRDVRAYEATVCAGQSAVFTGLLPGKVHDVRIWALDFEGASRNP
jgi:Tol biopolymer transport system component